MDYPCILTLRLARKEGEELYGQFEACGGGSFGVKPKLVHDGWKGLGRFKTRV